MRAVQRFKVTISSGVPAFSQHAADKYLLIKSADAALYEKPNTPGKRSL